MEQWLSVSRSFSRLFHSHKHIRARALQTEKQASARGSKKKQLEHKPLQPLWAPFREVLPEHEEQVAREFQDEEEGDDVEGRGAAARFWRVLPSEASQRAADTVTPLWRLSYARQLQVKQARTRALLRQLGRQLAQQGSPLTHHGLPCTLDDILPAPETEHYRNKDEYKVGEGVDGDPKTVGFMFGSAAQGPPLCLPPDGVRVLKPAHVKVAQAFQQFVRASPLAACCQLHDGGHWRTLLVRSSARGRLLASVAIHPRQLTRQQLDEQRDQLRHFFQSGPGADCGLQSLLLQECPHVRCSGEQAPYQPLLGPAALEDELCGLRLNVSPDAFLQVNLSAAEELYRLVERQADLSPASVLLDLCCGTGAISLLLSRHCRSAVGVEVTASAVRDAAENARLNGIQNVEFVTGRVDKVLPKITAELELCSEMVAVLNPGRAGVANRVIEQLRKTPAVRRVVYIACRADHQYTSANLVALGRPGPQSFRLVRASPVDLFPHTDHVELVLTFQR